MQSIHDSFRKFLTEGTFKQPDETRLLREIDEDELGHIQRALDEMGPEDLAFNELFDGKNRVLIPFPVADTTSELGRFIKIVKLPDDTSSLPDNSSPWLADFQKGLMTRIKPFNAGEEPREIAALAFGDKQVKRREESMKIGKWLAAVERALKGLVEYHRVWRADDHEELARHEGTFQKKTRPALLKLLGVSRYAQIKERFLLKDMDNYADEKILKLVADLRQYWQQNADYIKKNPEGIKSEDIYSIIVTRHPIDVLRMSDFDDIYSCHSPPSHHHPPGESYYKCAVAEAHGHGAVAYVVKNEDLEDTFEYPWNLISGAGDFQEDEIFRDEKRGEGQIEPVSRLRLRQVRYYKDRDKAKRWDEGVELAIPEKKIYGERIPGLREVVANWARENQEEAISNVPTKMGRPAYMDPEEDGIDLGKFVKFGGSYEDHKIHTLISNFLGMPGFGRVEQNIETEEQLDASLVYNFSERLQADAQEVLGAYSFSDFGVTFEVEADESPYIVPNILLDLSWDESEWKSLPDFQLMGHLPSELEDFGRPYDAMGDHPTVRKVDSEIIVRFRIDSQKLDSEEMGIFHSVHEWETFLDTISDMERDGTVDTVRALTERFMKREGHMEGGVLMKFGYEVLNKEFTSYTWHLEAEEGYELDEFELISATTLIGMSYKNTTLEAAERILGSRDFWLKLRRQMHIKPQEYADEEYYVSIEKYAHDVEEDEKIILYRLNYHVGDDAPDGQVEVFKELLEFWEDEDELAAKVQEVFDSFIKKAGTLKQVDPELNINESKRVSGQQLFNNWRKFCQ